MKNNRINVQQRLETALAESADHYRDGTQIMRDLITLLESAKAPNVEWVEQMHARIKQAEVWLAD